MSTYYGRVGGGGAPIARVVLERALKVPDRAARPAQTVRVAIGTIVVERPRTRRARERGRRAGAGRCSAAGSGGRRRVARRAAVEERMPPEHDLGRRRARLVREEGRDVSA